MKRYLLVSTVSVGFLVLCGLFAFEYRQNLNNKSLIQAMVKETDDLRMQNRELREVLKKGQEMSESGIVAPVHEQGSNVPALESQSSLDASAKDPNADASKSAGLSPQALKVIQNALQQVQRQKFAVKNDTNEIAGLRQENEQLKRELAQLKSQISIQQTGTTVLTEIQSEKSQTEAVIASIVDELRTNPNPTQKTKLLQSLSELAGSQDPALLPIIQQAIEDPNPDIQAVAMQLLSSYHGPETMPLIDAAFDAPDMAIRMAAIERCSAVGDPAVSDLYIKAVADQEEDVRTAALSEMDKQSDEVQLAVYKTGISSPYSDVKTETLSQLELRGDHPSVDIVIEGLKDPDPEFMQQVNSTLSFLIGKEFNTYQEAQEWWSENKNNYDENLVEK